MFVQSVKFVEEHGGRKGDVRVFGQEAVPTTWRLAKMNLAVRHIDAELGDGPADSFHEDKHPDLRADFVLANPPFNQSEWGGHLLRSDRRWAFGIPAETNANFAWVQLFLHHLAPTGTAGFVLATGALSARGQDAEIREHIVDAGIVDCIVSLPSKLFFGTPTTSVALWFLSKGKQTRATRRDEVLMIDARAAGRLVARNQRVLTDDDVATIADTFHEWRDGGDFSDVVGFCRSVQVDDIRSRGYLLTPGTYVGNVIGSESDLTDVAVARAELAGLMAETSRLGNALLEQLDRIS